jgi:uncharacterized DUF497 family protein
MDEKSVSSGEDLAASPQFERDANNIGHIARHDVKPEEAEQVLLNDPIALDIQFDEGEEERWPYIGETATGRILRVVITLRGEQIRVVTAFEPSKWNKQAYLATRAGLHDRSETT